MKRIGNSWDDRFLVLAILIPGSGPGDRHSPLVCANIYPTQSGFGQGNLRSLGASNPRTDYIQPTARIGTRITRLKLH